MNKSSGTNTQLTPSVRPFAVGIYPGDACRRTALQILTLPLAVLALAICSLPAALGQGAEQAAEVGKNPLGRGPEVVEAGHAAFNRTCTGCHGTNGAQGDRAPALVGERRFFRLTENSIFETIKNGIPGTNMPSFSSLPDQQIWQMVVYIRAMRGSASGANVPGNVQQGKEVFAGKGGCMNCHMINGHGGIMGPDLSNLGAQATVQQIRQALTTARAITPGYRPVKVVTADGRIIEGIAKNEDAFSIQVLDTQHHLHLYSTAELREVDHERTSLMPHDYDKVLTPDELQNLVAMLAHQVVAELHTHVQGEGEVGR